MVVTRAKRRVDINKPQLTRVLSVALAGLVLAAFSAAAAVARPQVETLATTLTGAEEVCAPNQRCGDPDGSGTAAVELNRKTGTVCFSITTANVSTPLLAGHIHEAPKGVAGPIVVTLFASPSDESVSGCTEGVSKKLIKDIQKNPQSYYVNVHNQEYPAGAVRGQLGDGL